MFHEGSSDDDEFPAGEAGYFGFSQGVQDWSGIH